MQVQDLPQISLTKTGRDSLVVSSADLEFDVIDNPPRKVKFRCDGFKLDGQCGPEGKFCTKTLQNCRKTGTSVY